jgi:hypothetical protein
MFYYPPRDRVLTAEGAEIGSWMNKPNPKDAGRGKRQLILGKAGPGLLAVGFLLQLVAAFC